MRATNLPLSVILTLVIHLVVLLLLFWQGSITRERSVERPPEIIRAQIVQDDPAVARRAAAEAERQRQAAAQRQREAEARQRQQEAERQAAAQRQREEEARRQAEAQRQRQEAERQRQQAERQRQEQQQAEAERQRQLQLQRQREEEQRARTAAERQRAEEEAIRRRVEEQRRLEAEAVRAEEARIRAESERAREEALAAQAARDAEAIANMEGIIFDMVSQHWTRPPGVTPELETRIRIRLLGSGELNDIQVTRASGNAAFDRSAVQAVERAAPFPLLRLEPRQRDRFRVIDLIFTPEDLAL